MRSRTCATEGPDDGHFQPTKGFIEQDENTPELMKRKMKVHREEKDGRTEVSGSVKKPQKAAESRKPATPDLSQTDLLQLLGIMEGEVQVWLPSLHRLFAPCSSCTASLYCFHVESLIEHISIICSDHMFVCPQTSQRFLQHNGMVFY